MSIITLILFAEHIHHTSEKWPENRTWYI